MSGHFRRSGSAGTGSSRRNSSSNSNSSHNLVPHQSNSQGRPSSSLAAAGSSGRHLTLAQKWAKQGQDAQTIVTDKQGRQRFHGAFTGGFSAGYYMTVGSEEGWTPGKFVSSRDASGKQRQQLVQRPEDFMDEDDDLAMGRRLDTHHGYAGADLAARRTQRVAETATDRVKSGQKTGSKASLDIPRELVVAAPASVGEQLMHAMGWRRGHGVGPRRMNRDTGCYSIPSDTAIQDMVPKNDTFGLGYKSLRPNQYYGSGADDQRRLLGFGTGSGGIGVAAASGFGLGALEDVEDDARAFALDDDKSMYDSVLGGEEDDTDAYFHRNEKKGDSAAELRRKRLRDLSRSGTSHAPSKQSVCSDGTRPLSGFVLSRQMRSDLLLRAFEPPAPPRGFVARHTFKVPAPLLRKRSPATQFQRTGRASGPLSDHQHTADDAAALGRGARLGSSAGVDPRLKAPVGAWAKSANAELQTPPAADGSANRTPSAFLAAAASSRSGVAAVDGKGAARPTLGHVPAAVQALAASMAARFTAGGIQNSTGIVKKDGSAASAAEEKERELATRPKVTRTVVPWQPESLLCKRFVVPHPQVDMSSGATGQPASSRRQDSRAPRTSSGTATLSALLAPPPIISRPHESHHMQKRLLQTIHGVNPDGSHSATARGGDAGTRSNQSRSTSAAIDSFLNAVQQDVLTERELFMQAYPDAPPLPPMPPPPDTQAGAKSAQGPATPSLPPPPMPGKGVGVNLFNEIFNVDSSDSEGDSDSNDGGGEPANPMNSKSESATRHGTMSRPAVENSTTAANTARGSGNSEGQLPQAAQSVSPAVPLRGFNGSIGPLITKRSEKSSTDDSDSSSTGSSDSQHRKKRSRHRHHRSSKKHKKDKKKKKKKSSSRKEKKSSHHRKRDKKSSRHR
eukprot:INCI3632.1.p1 GENE.INCI3632.1~~INCI3632.1.p1  ORF type:complete len:932 (+),score=136.21 INCI3632.1:84-2798(+)